MLWVAGSMDGMRPGRFNGGSDDHSIIVFDDMHETFLQMDEDKQLCLCDVESERTFGKEIGVRYTAVTVPENVPRIFVVNSMPFDMQKAKIAAQKAQQKKNGGSKHSDQD